RGIVSAIERVIHLDYTSLALLDPVSGILKIYALDFPGGQHLIQPEMAVSRDASPAGKAIATGQTVVARASEFDQYSSEVVQIVRNEGIQAVGCIPLVTHGRTFGSLNLASRRLDALAPQDIELLQQIGAQIAIAVENALAFKEIDALKDTLSKEK